VAQAVQEAFQDKVLQQLVEWPPHGMRSIEQALMD